MSGTYLRALAMVPLMLVASCATLFPPPMPPLTSGVQREKVTEGFSSCTGQNCRHNVRVGAHRFRVETNVRIVTANELAGSDGPSAAERAAGGLIGWAARQAGLTTLDEQVVVGTRTVSSEGTAWRLLCHVAWIDTRERSPSETAYQRITESMECRQQSASDTSEVGGPWRFHFATATAADSLAAAASSGSATRDAGSLYGAQLERRPEASLYKVVEESFGKLLWMPRSGGWRVERADGGMVGALRLPPLFACLGPCAVDFGTATEEERVVLRFIAAALMIPLRLP